MLGRVCRAFGHDFDDVFLDQFFEITLSRPPDTRGDRLILIDGEHALNNKTLNRLLLMFIQPDLINLLKLAILFCFHGE